MTPSPLHAVKGIRAGNGNPEIAMFLDDLEAEDYTLTLLIGNGTFVFDSGLERLFLLHRPKVLPNCCRQSSEFAHDRLKATVHEALPGWRNW